MTSTPPATTPPATAAPVTELATEQAYLDTVATVRDAAARYYADGSNPLDDATYDAHLRGLAAAETLHPEWKVPDSPTDLVGAGAEPVAVDHAVRHSTPMLSLGNLFSAEELQDWLAGRERLLGSPVSGYVVEPKYDGSACSAVYEDGRLVRIATRGDGTTGEDRTYAVDRISNLPRELTQPFNGEVRGEVLFHRADYEAANEARTASGKDAYTYARSAATSAFGAETLGYPVRLTFKAYGLSGAEGIVRHSESFDRLVELGFPGVETALVTRCDDAADVAAAVARFSEVRADLDFDIDGAVVKVDLLAEQATLGLASRAPRWGTAFKYPADTAISVLEEVLWQVGRTGVITPRARITPTVVGGTTVTYATLHNPTDVARKGFLLGDQVTVKRAGEVIPRLEAPLVAARTGAETEIEVPETCPRCGSDIDRSQVRWRCTRGRQCGLAESIRYAASRDALDLEGMGEKIVQALTESGTVADVADLFTLTREDLLAVERLGEANTDKLLAQIENARTQPLSRVLTALGVRMTGRSMSRRLARSFGSMQALQAASPAELEDVEGVGPERAASIREELDELAPVIAKLEAAGVTLTEESAAAGAELPLAGQTVVVSGNVPGFTRTTANEAVERLGGRSSSSVSARTSLVVTAETTTGKAKKAADLGIPLMTPEDFAALVAEHS